MTLSTKRKGNTMTAKTYSISDKYDLFYNPNDGKIHAHFTTDARPGSKAFAQAVRDFEIANGYEAGTFYFYDGEHAIKRVFKSERF